jgi:hypothetical protein
LDDCDWVAEGLVNLYGEMIANDGGVEMVNENGMAE